MAPAKIFHTGRSIPIRVDWKGRLVNRHKELFNDDYDNAIQQEFGHVKIHHFISVCAMQRLRL